MAGLHQSDRTGISDQSRQEWSGFLEVTKDWPWSVVSRLKDHIQCNFLTGSAAEVNSTCDHVVRACRNSLKYH